MALEGDIDPCQIKAMGEDCISQTVDWVWDEDGNDVTPVAIIGSD